MRVYLAVAVFAATCVLEIGGGIRSAGRAQAQDAAANYPLFPVKIVVPYPAGSIPDTLVLGCTHFPVLAGAIRRAVGEGVQIVDSAATTAASVDAQLRDAGLTAAAGASGGVRLLATDGSERFARVGSRFLERPIAVDEVELVDL